MTSQYSAFEKQLYRCVPCCGRTCPRNRCAQRRVVAHPLKPIDYEAAADEQQDLQQQSALAARLTLNKGDRMTIEGKKIAILIAPRGTEEPEFAQRRRLSRRPAAR